VCCALSMMGGLLGGWAALVTGADASLARRVPGVGCSCFIDGLRLCAGPELVAGSLCCVDDSCREPTTGWVLPGLCLACVTSPPQQPSTHPHGQRHSAAAGRQMWCKAPAPVACLPNLSPGHSSAGPHVQPCRLAPIPPCQPHPHPAAVLSPACLLLHMPLFPCMLVPIPFQPSTPHTSPATTTCPHLHISSPCHHHRPPGPGAA
jgi:hypothetical protein